MTKILIADNDPVSLTSFAFFLKVSGFEVEEASSVQEAVEKLRSVFVDLVVSDLRLTNDSDPNDTTGLDVAKAARDQSVPCILVSGIAPPTDAVRKALRTTDGTPLAVDFVPKKEGPLAVEAAIKVVLGIA